MNLKNPATFSSRRQLREMTQPQMIKMACQLVKGYFMPRG